MASIKQVDIFKYILDKQLSSIQHSDSKSSTFLSLTGILIALSSYVGLPKQISNMIKFRSIVSFKTFIFFMIILISLFFIFIGVLSLLFSISPRLKSPFKRKSYMYFGDISSMDFYDLRKCLKIGYNFEDDLIGQIYVNSIIANKKMKCCNFGIKFVFMGFFIIYIFMFAFFIFS